MKTKLFKIASIFAIITGAQVANAQAPTLGSTAGFVLFSSNGALTNTGLSHLTGNVGSNNGSSTAFGNVNGVMNNNNGASALAATDLLVAYNQLNAAIPTFFPAPLLGNGQSLNAGIYSISGNATLNNTLTLNGQGNANAVFIIQIQGAFSAAAGARVILSNGAKACNVFWKVEGLVSLASNSTLKGTIIANNAAIAISSGASLEGRAMTTTGAITIDNILAYTPIGCGSPVLTGPSSPTLGTAACYVLFSGNGAVTNSGSTTATGDIGTNVGLTTGFNPLNVTGVIHPIPDGSTGACATDLLTAYNYLNTLPFDIELLSPAQFGNSLVLTPHVYRMNAAAMMTDTLFLNGGGNAAAVFVIQINGAFSTSTYAKVQLTNGTQAANVFWVVNGGISINNYSEMEGTFVANNGAVSVLIGSIVNGRVFTTNGAFATDAITATMPAGCSNATAPSITGQPSSQVVCTGGQAVYTVSASGSGLTYQWRKGTTNLTNGANVSGATTATLTLSSIIAANAGTDYNVVITGAVSPTVTSNNVSLTLEALPTIGTEPVSQISCDGSSAIFAVSASGSALTYQWRKGIVNLVNGANISGATTATLTVSNVTVLDSGSVYNVVITDQCTQTVNSTTVSLKICDITGIKTEYLNNIASIYPNPFNSSLTVKLNGMPTSAHTLAIYDNMGKVVFQTNITEQSQQLNTSELSDGIYFYRIYNSIEIIQSGKLVSGQ